MNKVMKDKMDELPNKEVSFKLNSVHITGNTEYTEEQLREIEYLKSNYEMLEKTKEEAKLRGTENAVKRIEMAQQDSIEQLKKIDIALIKELNIKENNDEYNFFSYKNADNLIDAINLDENKTKAIDFEKI